MLNGSSGPTLEAYDAVPYPDRPCYPSHPDRLAVVGRLFGLNPAPVESCRVLELGCASGGNLIPIAEELPNSQFVGLDLSRNQIIEGHKHIQNNRLTNIQLIHGDILDFDSHNEEPFDYIISHGVYSWVPPHIQHAMLAICRKYLKPHGIAYISYNAMPGWHLRNMVRDAMRYHTSSLSKAEDKVLQARAVLRFLSSLPGDNPYTMVFQQEAVNLAGNSNSYLLHDYLADDNYPCYFTDFVRSAGEHDLQYLGEAELTEMMLARASEPVQQTLPHLVQDPLMMEQYLDFVRVSSFRRTLLCHAELPVDRGLTWEPLQEMWVGTRLTAANPEASPDGTPMQFIKQDKPVLTTGNPLLQAAMQLLAHQGPEPMAFSELCRRTWSRLGHASTPSDAEIEALGRGVLTCYVYDFVELYPRSHNFQRHTGQRPAARPYAAYQARNGEEEVTNFQHRPVLIDAFQSALLQCLDGDRTVAGLVEAMMRHVDHGDLSLERDSQPIEDANEARQVLRKLIPQHLEAFSRHALLQ